MGRHAPEQEYEIIFCRNQHSSGLAGQWGYYNSGLTAGVNVAFKASGFTAPRTVSTGTANQYPFCNNMVTYVAEDNTTRVNFTPISGYISGGDSVRSVLHPIYEPASGNQKISLGGGNAAPILPVLTGFTKSAVTIESSLSGAKWNVKYEQLSSLTGILLGQGYAIANPSGYLVGIQTISFTGATPVLGGNQYVPDTINPTATGTAIGSTARYTFPSFAVDTSYTGDIKRILVGYLGITGTTSGQLCARLAEISGTTITYGDPVVVRSQLSSGTYRQSIDVTYHSSGDSANCFVIATTISPSGAGIFHCTSGELVACKPPSGLVLSGYFGTPVTAFESNTTGVTGFISQIKCAALNITNSGSGEPAFGYLAGIRGVTSGVPTGTLLLQQYRVSGTTITTGSVVDTGFAFNNLGTKIEVSGSDAHKIPPYTFKSINIRNFATGVGGNLSGLVSFLGTNGTGIQASLTGISGSGFAQYYAVRATGTAATSIYVTGYHNLSGGRYWQQPYFVIPENPYSGQLYSTFYLEPRQASSGLYEQALFIGEFDRNSFSGIANCLLKSGAVYTTGTLNTTTGTGSGNSGESTNYRNIIAVSGTYPEYRYFYTIEPSIFNDIYIGSVLFRYDLGISGDSLRNAGAGYRLISGWNTDNQAYKIPLGLCIGTTGNINTTGVRTVSGETLLYFDSVDDLYQKHVTTSGIVVKVAETDSQRRKFANGTVASSIVLVDTRNQLTIN